MSTALGIEDAVSGQSIVATHSATAQGDGQLERTPIAGRARTNLLVICRDRRSADDSILVRSLVGLLGVDLEHLMIHRDQQREEGAGLLRSDRKRKAEHRQNPRWYPPLIHMYEKGSATTETKKAPEGAWKNNACESGHGAAIMDK